MRRLAARLFAWLPVLLFSAAVGGAGEIVQRFPLTSGFDWDQNDDGHLFESQPEKLVVWDRSRMQARAALPIPRSTAAFVSKNGRWLAAWHKSELSVWDLGTFSKRLHVTGPAEGECGPLSFDGDVIAVLHKDHREKTCQIHVIDLTSEQTKYRRTVPYEVAFGGAFYPRSKLWCLHDARGGAILLDSATGAELWRTDLRYLSVYEDSNLAIGAIREIGDTIGAQFLDLQTGQPIPMDWDVKWIRSSASERLLLLVTWNSAPSLLDQWLAKLMPSRFGGEYQLRVVETATLREVLHFRCRPGDETHIDDHSFLSQDGSTLVIDSANRTGRTITVWDVSPRRAWLYAVVSSGATAGAVLLFSRWRRRRASPRAVAETHGAGPV